MKTRLVATYEMLPLHIPKCAPDRHPKFPRTARTSNTHLHQRHAEEQSSNTKYIKARITQNTIRHRKALPLLPWPIVLKLSRPMASVSKRSIPIIPISDEYPAK